MGEAGSVILMLAGLLAGSTMCQSLGAVVRCELAPPRPIAVALSVPHAAPLAATHEACRAPPTRHHVRSATPEGPAGPPSDAEIGRHLASLTEIGDCTGARAFALSLGDHALADRTFGTCLGTH